LVSAALIGVGVILAVFDRFFAAVVGMNGDNHRLIQVSEIEFERFR
jgi:hypothetical protein